jgi:peptidoglycan-N-acetylglucosamine deacetylase
VHEHDSVTLTRRDAVWLLGIAAAILMVLAVVFAARMGRPARATVDGTRLDIPYGTTISELERNSRLVSRHGKLLAVDGSVIATAGGAPTSVLRNGRPATESQHVLDGDVIESRDGSDTVEATVTLREPVPVKTRVTGSGPVMRLATPGAVGVRVRVAGSVSDKTVSETMAVQPQEMLIVRTHPNPSEKLVALTFDDGPWPGQTDKIVDILQHEGVRATFFMLGVRVNAHPALARKVARGGNLLGTHTLGHRNLTKSTPKEIRRQITGGVSAIRNATGETPTWFRPPYGALNAKVWTEVRGLGVRVALWDVDTRDWTRPGVKKIVRRGTKGVKKGSIILMHDGGVDRRQTIAALPQIIAKFKERGYVFVTLQELANAD